MPFQLRATVTHRASNRPDRTAAAVVTLSVMALSQARPADGVRNVKNSYLAASAGERWIRKCWRSSNSSAATSALGDARSTVFGSGGLSIPIGLWLLPELVSTASSRAFRKILL